MSGGQGNHRGLPVVELLGDMQGDGSMRVAEVAGLRIAGEDTRRCLGLRGAASVEDFADGVAQRLRQLVSRARGENRHQARNKRGVAPGGLEQETFEVRGNLDIHRGRIGRDHVAQGMIAGVQRTGQDIVFVISNDEAINGQAHQMRDITCIDIAEIPGRHTEADLAIRRTEGRRGGEVIDHLRHDAAPVDRVHRREVEPFAQVGAGEERFHEVLTIVKAPVEGYGVAVVGIQRGHLAALKFRYLAVGIHEEHIDPLAFKEGSKRGAAGIARGCADDGQTLSLFRENVVDEACEDLHGEILESERRAVEQFEQPVVRAKLHQRGYCRMGEPGISVFDHLFQLVPRDFAAGEFFHHREGDLDIGTAAKTGDFFGGEARPDVGDVETAIARKPGQKGLFEGEIAGVATGRNVFHRFSQSG